MVQHNNECIVKIVTGYIVEVDEASEIKSGYLCIIGAQTSRLMAKGSRLMKN